MKVFGVVGWKNSGKTTLMERLVAEIVGRGFTVSTIKHTHHAVDLDRPGKDSFRHRAAGATEVMLASSARFALMRELGGDEEPALATLLSRMDAVDLVLVEGFKGERHKKLEVSRSATGQPLIARDDPTVVAVASDAAHAGLGRPVYALDDVEGVAGFILEATGLAPAQRVGLASRTQ